MKICKLNKSLSFVVTIVVGAVIFLGLSGCLMSNQNNRFSYVVDYEKNINQSLEQAVLLEQSGFNADWVENKIAYALGDMKSDSLSANIREVYADKLYFNDTLHTHTNAKSLAEYMEKTVHSVHTIEIEFNDTVVNQKDAYVRWVMSFKKSPKSEPVTSIGMTHLRFNAQGEIILHQDYWDGVEGLYRTVPILGFMLERVKKAL